MKDGAAGQVVGMLLRADAQKLLGREGFGIGSQVVRNAHGLVLENGDELHLSDDWLRGVFVSLSEDSA